MFAYLSKKISMPNNTVLNVVATKQNQWIEDFCFGKRGEFAVWF